MAEKKMKRLCKWKKAQYDKEFNQLAGIVGNARFACRKCGRAAADRKVLCRPDKLG